ncbi:hypothetical protein [Enterococcus canintestini]|uniref:Uncharacterized protein n=1 Tax=Enterococcus canintestini TaxID=317010 RepID=A0A267HWS1_9ENTE|nr:hypothetical protein [Enterococcus canintestini]PAB01953.1 hypothetical protein AKL21_00110 [Enterococcus canintestini]
MNPFFSVFKKTQQFLLLQAYADSIMSEEELMTFLLNETSDERFCLISQKGLYIVTPNVSLDAFTHIFIAPENVHVKIDASTIVLEVPSEIIQIPFKELTDAQNILADITYLWKN